MHDRHNEPPDIKLKTAGFSLGTSFTCTHKSTKTFREEVLTVLQT